MKPKMTDSVSCDQLLCSFESRITLFEITINQWRDDTLSCCLSVNRNTSLNNELLVCSAGGESFRMMGRISQGSNKPEGEKARG